MKVSEMKSAIAAAGIPLPINITRQDRLQPSLSLKEMCNLLRITAPSVEANGHFRFEHVQFKAHRLIHRMDQQFNMLFLVRSGFIKTSLIDEFGNEQVVSFPMKGDLVGLTGIFNNRYASEATTLSSCDIILIPFKIFAVLGRLHPELVNALYGVMSHELLREQAMISTRTSLKAEARVARFLVSLSNRYAEMGYSDKQFSLHMTRSEIGSYLGLSLETVSRSFSALSEVGLISVNHRTVHIHDINSLRTLHRLPFLSLQTREHSPNR
jgi:CRP/FNR family transcriptional regulator